MLFGSPASGYARPRSHSTHGHLTLQPVGLNLADPRRSGGCAAALSVDAGSRRARSIRRTVHWSAPWGDHQDADLDRWGAQSEIDRAIPANPDNQQLPPLV